MAANRAKFFTQLPADLNDYIANKLSFRDFNHLSETSAGGRGYVRAMRDSKTGLHNLFELAGSTREDFCAYLNHYFAAGSDNRQQLETNARSLQFSPLDYALYALVSNVRAVDQAKLEATIAALLQDARLTSIVASLNIINCYLSQQPEAQKQEELRALIEAAKGIYINLSGATLVGNYAGLDWSYANLSSARVLFDTAGCNFEGADITSIVIGGHAKMDDLLPEGQLYEDPATSDRVLAWDYHAISGFFMFDPSPLIKDAANRGEIPVEIKFGCNIL